MPSTITKVPPPITSTLPIRRKNSTYNGNYQADKGSSHLDQRQRLVVSAIIAPPRKDFGSAIANAAANGWLLSIIETAASPQYVDPILIVSSSIGGLASGTTINGMVTPFGAPGRVPFLPRSSVPIDVVNHMDARITKTFVFREAMSLALNFEAFNVLNLIDNTSVIQNAYFATGNILKAGAGVGNGSASGGFPTVRTRAAPRCRLALRSRTKAQTERGAKLPELGARVAPFVLSSTPGIGCLNCYNAGLPAQWSPHFLDGAAVQTTLLDYLRDH